MLGIAITGCVPEPGLSRPTLELVHSQSESPAPSSPIHREFVLTGTAQQGSVMIGKAPTGTRTVMLDGRKVPVARDGSFLIAFDRDAPPAAMLVALGEDGVETRRALTVGQGNWQIERVNAPITGDATSAEFKVRRGAELERINAARNAMRPGSSDGWRQAFIWPVAARISGRFGSQRIYRGTPGSYHSGVDLAAVAGSTYVAPADGVVILAASEPFTLEGNLLLIDHGMGLNSAFLHSQRLLVKVGDVVRRGQPIGIVGATGRVTGPHLHWGMKWYDARLDPVALVNLAPPPPPR
jgi:murein DD-endopeptidase MepM/ murein hydrolase activator NlpD